MSFLKKYSLALIIFLLATTFAYYLHFNVHPALRLNELLLKRGDSSYQKVDFKYKQRSGKVPYKYNYKAKTYWNGRSNAVLQIIPDDCLRELKVNNKIINIEEFKPRLCNNKVGFRINLGKYLDVGPNELNLIVEDTVSGGDTALSLITHKLHFVDQELALTITVFLSLAAFWWIVLSSQSLPSSWKWMSTISIFLMVVHYFQTSIDNYAYDNFAHCGLVKYYAQHWWPEPVGESFLSYHPPLYYYLSAAIFRLFDSRQLPGLEAVRFMSIICYLVFQLFGLKALQLVKTNSLVRSLIAACLLFWPLTDFTSGRINNELLLYSLWAIAIYYYFKWLETARWRHLNFALIAVAFGIVTKTNAYIILISICCSEFLQLICTIKYSTFWTDLKNKLFPTIKYCWPSALLIIGAICLASIRVASYKYETDKPAGLLVSNISVYDFAEKTSLNIIPNPILDFQALFNSPFPHTGGDPNGYVHNYFVHIIKSIFYGEGYGQGEHIARALNFFALTILILIAWSLFRKNRAKLQIHYLLWVAIGIGLHLANYLNIPVICTADSRYIYPLFILILMYIASTLDFKSVEEGLQSNYVKTALLLLILFSSTSFTYLLAQHLLNR